MRRINSEGQNSCSLNGSSIYSQSSGKRKNTHNDLSSKGSCTYTTHLKMTCCLIIVESEVVTSSIKGCGWPVAMDLSFSIYHIWKATWLHMVKWWEISVLIKNFHHNIPSLFYLNLSLVSLMFLMRSLLSD